jgi:hypothetical protein
MSARDKNVVILPQLFKVYGLHFHILTFTSFVCKEWAVAFLMDDES